AWWHRCQVVPCWDARSLCRNQRDACDMTGHSSRGTKNDDEGTTGRHARTPSAAIRVGGIDVSGRQTADTLEAARPLQPAGRGGVGRDRAMIADGKGAITRKGSPQV